MVISARDRTIRVAVKKVLFSWYGCQARFLRRVLIGVLRSYPLPVGKFVQVHSLSLSPLSLFGFHAYPFLAQTRFALQA